MNNHNEELENQLNKLLCDLNVAGYNMLHAKWTVKGQGSHQLSGMYNYYGVNLSCFINQVAERMMQIELVPLSSMIELAQNASIRSLKPDGFRTVPAVLDTLIHLTEIVADVHALVMEDEDEVTAHILIEMNKSLEKYIWDLKKEFAKPEAEIKVEKKG